MMHRLWILPAGIALAGLLSGCGDSGPKLAPISGVVTLNGKPYPNALVSFQPVGTKGNPNPGKGSVGQTDASGKFEMVYEGAKKGAVIGPHLVRISTTPGKGEAEDPTIDKSLGSPDGVVLPKGQSVKMDFDPIPMEWNEKSAQTFEVKPGGDNNVKFDIVSKKK